MQDDSLLMAIIERASTLYERVDGLVQPSPDSLNESIIEQRLQHWTAITAQGRIERLERRLSWDNLNIASAKSLLGSVQYRLPNQLPQWAKTLQDVFAVSQNYPGSTNLELDQTIPFFEFFGPFLLVARNNLRIRLGDFDSTLSPQSFKALEQNFLSRLLDLASQPLLLKFALFRSSERRRLASIAQKHNYSSSNVLYNAFISDLLDNYIRFFQEYSTLGRLMATILDSWVETTREFLVRLATDKNLLQQTLNKGKSLGQVIAIEPGLSDYHNNGRAVMRITFSSGQRLIYKPKCVGSERSYFDLLDWLNIQGAPLPFKTIKVLDRKTYGWVEDVAHLACEDRESIRRFYQRAGMLLCLLYVLQATDCHNENIIAHGEHPVLVDTETLLHHQIQEEVISTPADEQFWNSVLRTGLLPRWEFGARGRSFDISGFGDDDAESSLLPVWKNINSDDMERIFEDVPDGFKASLPRFHGRSVSAREHLDELVSGFRDMYQFLIAHRSLLCSESSPLQALGDQPVRFVFRNTRVYSAIRTRIGHPRCLREGIELSLAADILSRALLTLNGDPPVFSPILREEHSMLEHLDVPFFSASPRGVDLKISTGRTIRQCFQEPSYEKAIRCLNEMSNDDLEQQIGFILASFYARSLSNGHGLVHSFHGDEVVAEQAFEDSFVPSKEALYHEAFQIAQDIKRNAIIGSNGSLHWIALGHNVIAERYRPEPISYSLFDGRCGIALFFAGVYALGGSDYREHTLNTLAPLRKILQEPDATSNLVRRIGLGASVGAGSILYSLVRVASFLKEDKLIDDAVQLARAITPEMIAKDDSLDVTSGAAGAILGLLAVHKGLTENWLLELADACGRHLLKRMVTNRDGFRAWPTTENQLLTGFSHGAAGIAYCLLHLFDVTNDSAFLKAATEAIDYERSVFVPEVGNWPDFRHPQPSYMLSWCHGAPGVGLARMGGLRILDTVQIRSDINISLQATRLAKFQGVESLCCGTLGRSEVFLTAAKLLSRPLLADEALHLASTSISRIKKEPAAIGLQYRPGFFQGASGIGYQLLRLAAPSFLPAVLLWE